MADIGQLRLLLRKSGYTRQHAARLLGISEKTLYSRLQGGSDFKLAEAEKLAALLELTAAQREAYFFGFAPGPGGSGRSASTPFTKGGKQ